MMNRFIVILFVLALLSIACAGSSSPTTTEDYIKEYGGNAQVYDRILALTDCEDLQVEFNKADANTKTQEPGTDQYQWSIGYMKAADQRMKDIGCYK